MKKLCTLLLIALTFSLSCTKENEDERELRKLRKTCRDGYAHKLNLPEGRWDTLVIEDSLNISFRKDYGSIRTADVPSSGQQGFGHLWPSKGVEVYQNEDGTPYHSSGSSVRIDVGSERDAWSDWGATILTKGGCYGLFEEKWTLDAGTENFYIVFRTEILQHMGWILLNADPDSGEITMTDFFLTTEHTVTLP